MRHATLFASLLLLSACATRPYPAYAIEDDAEERASVVVSDRSLQGAVRVGKAHVERVPGSNSLRVVVPIRNIDDEEIQVLAQMTFRNRQKVSIGDSTNRQVLVIPPGSTMEFASTSRTDEVHDWLVRLSWNK